jgi:hypothetical protein
MEIKKAGMEAVIDLEAKGEKKKRFSGQEKLLILSEIDGRDKTDAQSGQCITSAVGQMP